MANRGGNRGKSSSNSDKDNNHGIGSGNDEKKSSRGHCDAGHLNPLGHWIICDGAMMTVTVTP